MKTREDLLRDLELLKTATDMEIKAQHKKLRIKYHPDKNPGDEKAAENFQKVQEAFKSLRELSEEKSEENPEKKAGELQRKIEFERTDILKHLKECEEHIQNNSTELDKLEKARKKILREITQIDGNISMLKTRLNAARKRLDDLKRASQREHDAKQASQNASIELKRIAQFKITYPELRKKNRFNNPFSDFLTDNKKSTPQQFIANLTIKVIKEPDSITAKAWQVALSTYPTIILPPPVPIREGPEIPQLEEQIKILVAEEKDLASKEEDISHEIGTRGRLEPVQEKKEELTRALKTLDKKHETLTIPLKLKAFKKIYHALRDGQSGFFKTNFLATQIDLSDSALLSEVKRYSGLNPTSRTAKAWQLTEIHFNQCLPNNAALFTEIYKYAYEKSGCFFKKSCITGITYFRSSTFNQEIIHLTHKQIEQSNTQKTRGGKICKALI